MDAAWTKLAIDVGQALLMGAIGFYLHFELRDRARATQVDALGEKMSKRLEEHEQRLTKLESRPMPTYCMDHGDRLVRVEQELKHVPTHQDLQDLSRHITECIGTANARMDSINADLAALAGETKAQTRILQALHQNMLPMRNA